MCRDDFYVGDRGSNPECAFTPQLTEFSPLIYGTQRAICICVCFFYKETGQAMYYYVILRRDHASVVAVENKLVLHILSGCSSLTY